MDSYLPIIQAASVVVAIAAVVTALGIATVDRKRADQRADADRQRADQRAADDRAAARAQAERRWTLDLLVALSGNLSNPDSMDRDESKRKGAERAALIQAIGPDRLPLCSQRFRGDGSLTEIAQRARDDPDASGVIRCEGEVYLLLQAVRDEQG